MSSTAHQHVSPLVRALRRLADFLASGDHGPAGKELLHARLLAAIDNAADVGVLDPTLGAVMLGLLDAPQTDVRTVLKELGLLDG